MHQEVLHKGPLIDTLKLISCNGVLASLTLFPKTDDFAQLTLGNTIRSRVGILVRLFCKPYIMLFTACTQSTH